MRPKNVRTRHVYELQVSLKGGSLHELQDWHSALQISEAFTTLKVIILSNWLIIFYLSMEIKDN